MNRNQSRNKNDKSDINLDHGTDASLKVHVKDNELLFVYDNENHNMSNHNNNQPESTETNGNVGWLGFVVSKIKIGANALGQVAINNSFLDENTKKLKSIK